jgi:hypothetical protein
MIPDEMEITSPAILALSGRGYADFQVVGANFRFTAFSEVRNS